MLSFFLKKREKKNFFFKFRKNKQLKLLKQNVDKDKTIKITTDIIKSSKVTLDIMTKKKPLFFESFFFDRVKYIKQLRNHLVKKGFKQKANQITLKLLRYIKVQYKICPIRLLRFVISQHFRGSLIKEVKLKKKSLFYLKKLSYKKYIFYMISNFLNEVNNLQSEKKNNSYKEFGNKTNFFLLSIQNYIDYYIEINNINPLNTAFAKKSKLLEQKIYKMKHFYTSSKKSFSSKKQFRSRMSDYKGHNYIKF